MDVLGVKELVGTMIEQILTSSVRKARALGQEHSQDFSVKSADEVVLYVNNIGGISTLEMSAIVDEIIQQLGK